jgi:outer membrane protein TolC
MKHVFAALFALGVVSLATAQQQLTLAQAIAYAQTNNTAIKNAQISIADADQQIIENLATGRPQVKLGLNHQTFLQMPKSVLPVEFAMGFIPRDSLGNLTRPVTKEDRQVVFGLRHSMTPALEVSQLVFSGSYLYARKAAKAFKEYTQINLQAELKIVADRVREAYLPALLIDESVATLNRNLTNLQKLRNETDEFRKAGFVEQLDVDRLDLSIANLETERDNLVRQRDLALNVLKFQMGMDINTPISLTDNLAALLDPALEIAPEFDFSNRPEVAVLDQAMRLRLIEQEVIKGSRLPVVAAFANYQIGLQAQNPAKEIFAIPVSVVGLSVSVPLYDGGSTKAKVERNRLNRALLDNQKNDMLRGFSLQAANATVNVRNAQARVTSQDKNLALAQRIYDTAQTKYRAGIGSSLEIIQAEQSLFQTQQNLTSAKFELLQAQIAYKQAVGK